MPVKKRLYSQLRRRGVNSVEMLIEYKADLDDVITEECLTPLIIAAHAGQENVVKKLINYKVDVNLGDKQKGKFPLIMAVKKGHDSIAEILLQHKADANLCDDLGNLSALLIASLLGHAGLVNKLIDYNSNINFASSQTGTTALCIASESNHLGVLETLLKRKAAVNQAEKRKGYTPLMFAIIHGDINTVNLLLEYKALVNQIDNNDYTAFFHTAILGKIDVAHALIENKADFLYPSKEKETPLLAAAEFGHTDIIQLLLELKASIDAATRAGWTPLMAAVWKNQLTAVKLLLSAKANVLQKSTQDFEEFPVDSTSISIASQCGHRSLVKLLIEHKAEPIDEKSSEQSGHEQMMAMIQFIQAQQKMRRPWISTMPQPRTHVTIEEMNDEENILDLPPVESKILSGTQSNSQSQTLQTIILERPGIEERENKNSSFTNTDQDDKQIGILVTDDFFSSSSTVPLSRASRTTPLLGQPPLTQVSVTRQFGNPINLFPRSSSRELVSPVEDQAVDTSLTSRQEKSCCRCIIC